MRSRLLPAALVSSTLVLSGCGTGLHAATYTQERSPRDFEGKSIANIEVRDLGIAPPISGSTLTAGDTAVLSGGLVNTGTTDDALVGVESDVASSSALEVDGKSVTSIPIPAGGDAGQWSALLSGLKSELHVAQYISVTLVFQRAGRLTGVQVPIRAGDTGLGSRTPAQDPYKSAE
ncbi:MAG: Copper chaperone PCu(A)C [Frankiales bacterium]|nr:Copper chaperone PCu(A)C [Frankiales bacterium]